MVIFHSYVSLPEGTTFYNNHEDGQWYFAVCTKMTGMFLMVFLDLHSPISCGKIKCICPSQSYVPDWSYRWCHPPVFVVKSPMLKSPMLKSPVLKRGPKFGQNPAIPRDPPPWWTSLQMAWPWSWGAWDSMETYWRSWGNTMGTVNDNDVFSI